MTQSRTLTAAEAQALLPTDDDVWKHPNETWDEMEARIGLSDNTLAKYLGRRGWKRRTGKVGGWGHAPCELCGGSFQIQSGQEKRRCPEHMEMDALPEEEKSDYQRELEAFKARSEAGKVAHLRRPYISPPAWRRRILPHEFTVTAA